MPVFKLILEMLVAAAFIRFALKNFKDDVSDSATRQTRVYKNITLFIIGGWLLIWGAFTYLVWCASTVLGALGTTIFTPFFLFLSERQSRPPEQSIGN